jgi:hypothetical protein
MERSLEGVVDGVDIGSFLEQEPKALLIACNNLFGEMGKKKKHKKSRSTYHAPFPRENNPRRYGSLPVRLVPCC